MAAGAAAAQEAENHGNEQGYCCANYLFRQDSKKCQALVSLNLC